MAALFRLANVLKEIGVSISLGYDTETKTVSGITFYFDNSAEFEEFLLKLEPVSQNKNC